VTNAVSAWWAAVTGDHSTAIQLLGVMAMPQQANKLTLDFSSLLGPLFYTWCVLRVKCGKECWKLQGHLARFPWVVLS
jgi:hypothetical protein